MERASGIRDPSLAERVHGNLIAVYRRAGDEPGGRVEERDGELLFAARSEFQFLNGVMRAGPGGDASTLLKRAREYFFGRGRGFCVFTWPGDPDLEEAAHGAGMPTLIDRYPEMVCRARLAELPGEVRAVEDRTSAAAYWEICDLAYPSIGFPSGVFAENYEPEALLGQEDVWACLAFDGDRPVAYASVYMAQGVGFVGWVAALPEARGRGFAAACTVRVTNRAFELGGEVASLQASSLGEEIYRRLGYEELFPYRVLGALPA